MLRCGSLAGQPAVDIWSLAAVNQVDRWPARISPVRLQTLDKTSLSQAARALLYTEARRNTEGAAMSKRFSLLTEILPIVIYLLACIVCSTYLLF